MFEREGYGVEAPIPFLTKDILEVCMAEDIIIPEGAKAIVLTNCDKIVIVDTDDYEHISQWKWFITHQGYAARNEYISYINGKQLCEIILMHRVILDTPKGLQGDHRNGVRLDNRKNNLRNSTHAQNERNRGSNKSYKGKKPTSQYKGVHLRSDGKKWCASIMADRKAVYLGSFITEEDAALAYNIAAEELHGEFAYLNELPHV